MKTISTLLTSFLLSVALFASDRPMGSLFVQSSDRGDVRVIMDGRRFESGDHSLLIRDVRAGNHDVRIYRQVSFGLFSRFAGKYEMVYDGTLFVKPGRQVAITIDRFGRTRMDEQKIWKNKNGNRFDEDPDFDRDHHDEDRYDRYGNDGDYQNYKYDGAINERDFNYVLQAIQREWYENNKMLSARQVIQTNYFSADQVKRMMQLFSFENNKLELAKLAYNKTVDPQNYQCVFNVLSFSSSKAELSRYIQFNR